MFKKERRQARMASNIKTNLVFFLDELSTTLSAGWSCDDGFCRAPMRTLEKIDNKKEEKDKE